MYKPKCTVGLCLGSWHSKLTILNGPQLVFVVDHVTETLQGVRKSESVGFLWFFAIHFFALRQWTFFSI